RLLRELEFLGAMALVDAGAPYPSETLAEFWELVLINQFHDIMPGTSIPEVYVDSDSEYGQIFSTLGSQNGPWHAAAQAFARPGADQLRLFNFTGQTRSGLVQLGDDAALRAASLATAGGTHPLQQIIAADGSTSFVAPIAELNPLGWVGGQIVAGGAANSSSP